MGVSETSDYIQIMINIKNPGQEPLEFSKAPTQDLEDIDSLCSFKIKIVPKL